MGESLSVVIPVYNSAKSLELLYDRLSKSLNRITKEYEIILVDDGSWDGSYAEMLRLHRKDGRVKIISLDGNFGQQNALMCGLNYAEGDYIITLDDDLQYLPEDMVKLLEMIEKGYDVVYGIPSTKDYHLYRRLGSKLTYFLFNRITSKPRKLKIGSFRIMKRELLKKVIKDKTSFVYISAIIFRYTDKAANVLVNHEPRKYGESNYNFVKLCKQFLKLFIYYSDCKFLKLFTSSKPTYVIKDIKL